MYGWLRGRFSKPAADALIVLWYALLMALVLVYAMESPGVFRYGNL